MSHQVQVKTTTYRDDINQNLYKPGSGITNFIKEIKTIYQDLTKDNDLVPAWHYTKREWKFECDVFVTCSKKYFVVLISVWLLQFSIMEGKLV